MDCLVLNLLGLLDLFLDPDQLLLQRLLLPDCLTQLLYCLLESCLIHQLRQGFLADILDWSSSLCTGCSTCLVSASSTTFGSNLLNLMSVFSLHLVHLCSVLLGQFNYCTIHLLDLSLKLILYFAFLVLDALGSVRVSGSATSVSAGYCWLLLERAWSLKSLFLGA